jgi:hypothetical protein
LGCDCVEFWQPTGCGDCGFGDGFQAKNNRAQQNRRQATSIGEPKDHSCQAKGQEVLKGPV